MLELWHIVCTDIILTLVHLLVLLYELLINAHPWVTLRALRIVVKVSVIMKFNLTDRQTNRQTNKPVVWNGMQYVIQTAIGMGNYQLIKW
jgi:hypothetical protein